MKKFSVNSPVHIVEEDDVTTLCGWTLTESWSRFSHGVVLAPGLCAHCQTIQTARDEEQVELPRFAFALPFGFGR